MAARARIRLVASLFNALNILTDDMWYPRRGHLDQGGPWSSLLHDDREQGSRAMYSIIRSWVLNAPYDLDDLKKERMGDSISLGQLRRRTRTRELTLLSESMQGGSKNLMQYPGSIFLSR